MNQKINLTINSTILYLMAFLITTIIHELSHAFIGMLNHSDPVLHHNYVEYLSMDHISTNQKILIALAGPIASLIQGIITGIAFLKSKKQGLLPLFLLWLSVLGFNNFFGYLMTGPIFQKGDIGKAFLLMNAPLTVQIIVALIGAGILTFIAYRLTIPFLQFSFKKNWVTDGQARKSFSFSIIILPWIIGSTISTLLYLPVIAIISIIYPIMSGMIFIFPWQNSVRIENVEISIDEKIGAISYVSVLLLIVLIAGFRLILAPGIQF